MQCSCRTYIYICPFILVAQKPGLLLASCETDRFCRSRRHFFSILFPLYHNQVKKGKKAEYAWDEEERKSLIAKFSNGKEEDNSVKIQRYKGLGEMNDTQLWDTTMNPETRILKQVTIMDGLEADNVFSMLMGEEVPPRRKFIEENAVYANIDV